MTYQGEPAGSGNTVLKTLVVLAVVFMAWWAVRGGYDQIPYTVPTTTEVTTTTVDG